MLSFVLILALASYAAGQLHGVCHSNHLEMTEDLVIGLVSMICDRNKDGTYTEGEIFVCTSEIVNHPLPVHEALILSLDYAGILALPELATYQIERRQFVQGWHLHFKDSPEFAGATFDAFDTNHDGIWTTMEMDNMLSLMKSYDSGNGILDHAEFEAFMKHMYAC